MPLTLHTSTIFCLQFLLTLVWFPICCTQEASWLAYLDKLASAIEAIFGLSHRVQTYILAGVTMAGVLANALWDAGDFPSLTIIKAGFFCAGLWYLCQQGIALKSIQALHPWRAPVHPSNLLNPLLMRYSSANLLAFFRRIGLIAFTTGFTLSAIELLLQPTAKLLFDLGLNLLAGLTLSWIVLQYTPKPFTFNLLRKLAQAT